MRYRDNKLYVSAALTAYLLLSDFDTAPVADNALIAYALILSARALIVACRTENALAEQSVTLRLVSPVINCLWFGDLTIRVLENLFRRSKTYGDLREIVLYFVSFLKAISFII